MSQASLSPHEPAVALSDLPNTKAVFAAIVAAAGNHPLLIVGGATAERMQLARAVTACLPPLTRKAYAALAFAHGTVGLYHPIDAPPFHWTTGEHSNAGGVLGGDTRTAGAVHLAHGGTLYLDDFSKFRPQIREAVFLDCDDPARRMPADFWLVGGSDDDPGPVISMAAPEQVGFEVVINLDGDGERARPAIATDDAEIIILRVRRTPLDDDEWLGHILGCSPLGVPPCDASPLLRTLCVMAVQCPTLFGVSSVGELSTHMIEEEARLLGGRWPDETIASLIGHTYE